MNLIALPQCIITFWALVYSMHWNHLIQNQNWPSFLYKTSLSGLMCGTRNKGQLISKMSLWCLQILPKNRTKRIVNLRYYSSWVEFFVRFWKNSFSTAARSWAISATVLWFGPLVSRIDWCKGQMVERLSDVGSKTDKKCIFCVFRP